MVRFATRLRVTKKYLENNNCFSDQSIFILKMQQCKTGGQASKRRKMVDEVGNTRSNMSSYFCATNISFLPEMSLVC